MSSNTGLPLDIAELILAELDGDEQTLKSCALVSRRLLVPARRHLFNTVKLTSEENCIRFSDLITSPQSEEISAFVQRLEIRVSEEVDYFLEEQHQPLVSIFTAVKPFLHEFEFSTLDSTPFDTINPAMQAVFMAIFASPNLHKISLGSFSHLPFAHLVTCISIKDFYIRHEYREEEHEHVFEQPPYAENLLPQCQPEVLDLSSCSSCAGSFLNFNLSSLRSLILIDHSFQHLRTLVVRTQERLENFVWSSKAHHSDSSMADFDNINLPNIRTLRLVVFFTQDPIKPMEFLVSLLKGCGSASHGRSLETITLALRLKDRELSMLDGSGLEATLKHGLYKTLRGVIFEIMYDGTLEEASVEKLLKDSMPYLLSRGILQ
ncbi:hypothetical protein H0H81_007730, partial [Sphagnurus paluster]